MAEEMTGNGGSLPRWAYDRLSEHDRQLARLADMPERVRNIQEDVRDIKDTLKSQDQRASARLAQREADERQAEGLHLSHAQALLGAFLSGITVIGSILYAVSLLGRATGH